MSKGARRKGHDFERECAELLRQLPGVSAERNLSETRDGNTGDLITSLPLAIQCKVGANPPLWTGLEEAIADAGRTGRTPVLMARRNRAPGREKRDVVVMRTADWLELVRRAQCAA
jgi:hypothetical protein